MEHDTEQATLGALLRSRRLGASIRTIEMARRLGKGRTTIFLWETDRGRPDPVDIRRWCEACQAPESVIAQALDLRSRAREQAA